MQRKKSPTKKATPGKLKKPAGKKAQAPLKKGAQPVKKDLGPKKVPAKKTPWPEPPSIGWERSRKQIMCRTGKGGPGSSYRIPFEGHGGPKGALQAAKAWLRDMSGGLMMFFPHRLCVAGLTIKMCLRKHILMVSPA